MHDLSGYQAIATPHEQVSEAEAAMLLEREYGLRGAVLHRITTERDDTFEVAFPQSQETDVEPDVKPVTEADAAAGAEPDTDRHYILKIENPAESYETILLRADVLRLLQVEDPQVPATRLVACADGGPLSCHDSDGTKRWATLTTFLPGSVLSGKGGRPTEPLLQDIGDKLARMQQVLASRNDYQDELGRVLWDVRLLPSLAEDILPIISDAQTRGLVERAVRDYASIEQEIESLPETLCHGDFHPGNITVRDDDPNNIAGILDFGDMHKMPAVCDLGTCLAYLADDHVDRPFLPCAETIRGYLRVNSGMGKDELRLLPGIIEARYALVILLPALVEHVTGPKEGHYLSDPVTRARRLARMQDYGFEAVLRDLFGE